MTTDCNITRRGILQTYHITGFTALSYRLYFYICMYVNFRKRSLRREGNFLNPGVNPTIFDLFAKLKSLASSIPEILKQFKICRQTDTVHCEPFPTSKH